MALADILAKIEEDAKKDRETIRKEGEAAMQEIQEETSRLKSEIEEEFARETQKYLAQKERSFLGIQKQKLNMLAEKEKRRLLDEVFQEAKQEAYPEQKKALEVEVTNLLFPKS